MKKSDKYPSASEEDINALSQSVKILGLHPLIWVAIVVFAISAARACDTVEKWGCKIHFSFSKSEDSNDISNAKDNVKANGASDQLLKPKLNQ